MWMKFQEMQFIFICQPFVMLQTVYSKVEFVKNSLKIKNRIQLDLKLKKDIWNFVFFMWMLQEPHEKLFKNSSVNYYFKYELLTSELKQMNSDSQ